VNNTVQLKSGVTLPGGVEGAPSLTTFQTHKSDKSGVVSVVVAVGLSLRFMTDVRPNVQTVRGRRTSFLRMVDFPYESVEVQRLLRECSVGVRGAT
jgi:hypothetical protein